MFFVWFGLVFCGGALYLQHEILLAHTWAGFLVITKGTVPMPVTHISQVDTHAARVPANIVLRAR